MTNDESIILLRNTRLLSAPCDIETNMLPNGTGQFPSIESISEMIRIIRALMFPDFFDRQRNSRELRSYYIGMELERLYYLLRGEIARALRFAGITGQCEAESQADKPALGFIDALPEIKRLLYTDVEAMYHNDPAASGYGEIILSYPVIKAMLHYRVAHALLMLNVPVIPRMLTESAHSVTGIDINPGAKIGEYFAIDHGTGVVIGETCVIGNHVTLYQGVTLGAKNFTFDSAGRPVNHARHPILEDNVTVYSNSSILGRITVGHDSVIGGNVWLTESVPPHSRVIQSKAVETRQ